MEHNLVAHNVIAKSPPAEPQTVLTVADIDPFEFNDVVNSAPVVGIVGEDGYGFGVTVSKLRMTLQESLEETLKARSGANGKRRRHDD